MDEKYEYEQHTFQTDCRVGGKQFCLSCGLLALNNDFTSWAIRMGCKHKLHSSYANKRYENTKLM